VENEIIHTSNSSNSVCELAKFEGGGICRVCHWGDLKSNSKVQANCAEENSHLSIKHSQSLQNNPIICL
jgi:hypothetical protein